jgi:hypothetical protein
MKFKNEILFFIIIILYFSHLNAMCQTPEKTGEFEIPTILAPPVIDGIIDDACWNEAVKLPLNYQTWPGNNIQASENTFAYLCYDKENIYIAFQVYDNEADKIRYTVCQRDNIFSDDYVGIYFDTFNDQRTYYSFFFNPLGIQADAENGNFNWDTQLTSQGIVTEEGYFIEVAIPFTSIKFPELSFDTTWGLRIKRYIPRKDEIISWMPESRDIPNWQLEEGKFHGFQDINPGHPVEIMPVIVGSSTDERDENGLFNPGSLKFEPGLNIKVGVTSELTLNTTLNPDFSQVEADAPQIDVNTRFPIFISEKRPFFLEGQEIFSTPYGVVHTRNIIDPDYGIKLTGKIDKNTLGFIFASDSAPGKLYEPGDEEYNKNALFTILRVKRDILKDSEIGFIFTDRKFSESFNRVYGIDGSLHFGKYRISFQGINSDTGNEDGETKSGGAYKAGLYYSGSNLYYGLSTNYVHPDFEASSGFIYRTGYKSYNFSMGYDFIAKDEKEFLRNWGPSFYSTYYYDTDGNLTEWYNSTNLSFSLRNNTYLYTYADFSYLKYEGQDFFPFAWGLSIDNSYSDRISGGFSVYYGDEINYDPDRLLLGRTFGGNVYLDLKFTDKIQNSISISKSRLSDRFTGETIYDVTTLREAFTYQFTRETSFRTMVDYNSYGGRMGANFLFSWNPNPGTTFYIGYDTRAFEDDEGLYKSDRRLFFMKMSYLFKL